VLIIFGLPIIIGGEEHNEHSSLVLLLQTDTTKSIFLFRNSPTDARASLETKLTDGNLFIKCTSYGLLGK
jgi:hypothetical protein